MIWSCIILYWSLLYVSARRCEAPSEPVLVLPRLYQCDKRSPTLLTSFSAVSSHENRQFYVTYDASCWLDLCIISAYQPQPISLFTSPHTESSSLRSISSFCYQHLAGRYRDQTKFILPGLIPWNVYLFCNQTCSVSLVFSEKTVLSDTVEFWLFTSCLLFVVGFSVIFFANLNASTNRS